MKKPSADLVSETFPHEGPDKVGAVLSVEDAGLEFVEMSPPGVRRMSGLLGLISTFWCGIFLAAAWPDWQSLKLLLPGFLLMPFYLLRMQRREASSWSVRIWRLGWWWHLAVLSIMPPLTFFWILVFPYWLALVGWIGRFGGEGTDRVMQNFSPGGGFTGVMYWSAFSTVVLFMCACRSAWISDRQWLQLRREGWQLAD